MTSLFITFNFWHIYFSFYFEHVMMIPIVIVITLYQVYKKQNDVILLCHEKKLNRKARSGAIFFEGVENMFQNYQLIFNRVQKEKVAYYSSTNQNESSS